MAWHQCGYRHRHQDGTLPLPLDLHGPSPNLPFFAALLPLAQPVCGPWPLVEVTEDSPSSLHPFMVIVELCVRGARLFEARVCPMHICYGLLSVGTLMEPNSYSWHTLCCAVGISICCMGVELIFPKLWARIVIFLVKFNLNLVK